LPRHAAQTGTQHACRATARVRWRPYPIRCL